MKWILLIGLILSAARARAFLTTLSCVMLAACREEALPQSAMSPAGSDARLILLLRNPAEMARAWHGELRLSFQEDVGSFEHAWRLQEARAFRCGFERRVGCCGTPAPVVAGARDATFAVSGVILEGATVTYDGTPQALTAEGEAVMSFALGDIPSAGIELPNFTPPKVEPTDAVDCYNLVIDDEKSVCSMVRQSLESSGYRVITAGAFQVGLSHSTQPCRPRSMPSASKGSAFRSMAVAFPPNDGPT